MEITLPDIDDLDNMNIGELRYELRRLILQATKAPVSSMRRKDLIQLIKVWRCIPKILQALPADVNKEDYTEEIIDDTTVLVPSFKKSN
jgi:hypothetical protein